MSHSIAGCGEHGTLHIPDRPRAERFPNTGFCRRLSHLFVRSSSSSKEELIGVLTARRTEVHPFTPAQIKLLETFADQAVIAIENVRLFQELKESLEQQTATSEILGVIASSPTEIQPVMDTIAENAAKVCGANDAVIRLVQGNVLRTAPITDPCRMLRWKELSTVNRLAAEPCWTGRSSTFPTWVLWCNRNFPLSMTPIFEWGVAQR